MSRLLRISAIGFAVLLIASIAAAGVGTAALDWSPMTQVAPTDLQQQGGSDDGPDQISVRAPRDEVSVGSSVTFGVEPVEGGGDVVYEWSITRNPVGSEAELLHDDRRVTALRPDVEGTYEMRVEVSEGRGLISTDTIEIEAVPSNTIRIGGTEYTNRGLLEAYAPILEFHENEAFHPTRYEALVENADLKRTQEPGDGERVTERENVTMLDLGDQVGEDDAIYFIAPEDDSSEAAKQYQDPTTYPRTVYGSVHEDVTFQGESYTAVVYTMFYVYDSKPFPLNSYNRHTGDQEWVTVLIDDGGRPTWVGAQQHHGGEYRRWEGTDRTDGRLRLYLAEGSHSTHFQSGKVQLYGHHLPEEAPFGLSDRFGPTDRLELSPIRYSWPWNQFRYSPYTFRYTDTTGGGDVWGRDGSNAPSVDHRYELVTLTGGEHWARSDVRIFTYPGQKDGPAAEFTTSRGGTEAWRSGDWLTDRLETFEQRPDVETVDERRVELAFIGCGGVTIRSDGTSDLVLEGVVADGSIVTRSYDGLSEEATRTLDEGVLRAATVTSDDGETVEDDNPRFSECLEELEGSSSDEGLDPRDDARTIGNGDHVEGELTEGDREHWYRLEAEAGQAIRFVGYVFRDGSRESITVYGPSDEELLNTSVRGVASDAIPYGIVAPETGTYYLQLRDTRALAGSPTPYDFVVSIVNSDPAGDNDDRTSAVPITPGEPVQDYRAEGDEDWFAVPAEAGDRITASLSIADDATFWTAYNDVGLEVVDESGQLISDHPPGVDTARTNVSGADHVAEQTATAPTEGIYYVRISAFNLEGYTAFDLTVDVTPGESPDGPYSRDDAITIADGDRIEGELTEDTAEHWYEFEARAGQAIRFVGYLFGIQGSQTLTVYGPSDEELLNTGIRGEAEDPMPYGVVAPETGTYYLKLDGTAATEDSPDYYDFDVSIVTHDPAGDNDDRTSAVPVTPGEPVQDHRAEGDEDWFAVSAEAGDRIPATISIAADARSWVGFNDVGLAIVDESGQQLGDDPPGIARTDGFIDEFEAEQTATAPADGTYYVRVSAFDLEGYTAYELSVDIAEGETVETDAPSPTASPTASPTPTESTTSTATDTPAATPSTVATATPTPTPTAAPTDSPSPGAATTGAAGSTTANDAAMAGIGGSWFQLLGSWLAGLTVAVRRRTARFRQEDR